MPLLVFGGLLLVALVTVGPFMLAAAFQAVVSAVITAFSWAAFWAFIALIFLFATIAMVVT